MNTDQGTKAAFRSYTAAGLLAGLWLVISAGGAFGDVLGQSHHLGLNFLDETADLGYPYFHPFLIDVNTPDWTYHPAPITEQPNIINGGALAGWTEAEVREAISLEVERMYREVDTGDPQTTLRIAIYNGPSPTSADGRRLNTIIAHNETANEWLLGKAQDGNLQYSPYEDTDRFPDDSYLAVVLPPHLDALSGLTLDTPEAVINLIAGTTAHEIAHLYGLGHVDRGEERPYPLMASGASGLLNADRLEQRWFTDEIGTQPDWGPNGSSVSALISTIGTVSVADFNMDDDVDVFQIDGSGDAQILTANLGMTGGARMRDGDASNDGDVDVWQIDGKGDAQLLSANLTVSLDTSAQADTPQAPSENSGSNFDIGGAAFETAEAIYNVVTGELKFQTGGNIGTMGIGSAVMYPLAADPFLTQPPAQADDASLAFWNPSGGLPVGLDSVGVVLPAGLAQEDMTFSYTPIGGQTTYAPVSIVPEPSTIAMALLGLLAVTCARCRRQRK